VLVQAPLFLRVLVQRRYSGGCTNTIRALVQMQGR
jgi:hypothetical protein